MTCFEDTIPQEQVWRLLISFIFTVIYSGRAIIAIQMIVILFKILTYATNTKAQSTRTMGFSLLNTTLVGVHADADPPLVFGETFLFNGYREEVQY